MKEKYMKLADKLYDDSVCLSEDEVVKIVETLYDMWYELSSEERDQTNLHYHKLNHQKWPGICLCGKTFD